MNLSISHIVPLSANNVSGGFLSTNKTVFIQYSGALYDFHGEEKRQTIIKSLLLFVTSKYQTTQEPKWPPKTGWGGGAQCFHMEVKVAVLNAIYQSQF